MALAGARCKQPLLGSALQSPEPDALGTLVTPGPRPRISPCPVLRCSRTHKPAVMHLQGKRLLFWGTSACPEGFRGPSQLWQAQGSLQLFAWAWGPCLLCPPLSVGLYPLPGLSPPPVASPWPATADALPASSSRVLPVKPRRSQATGSRGLPDPVPSHPTQGNSPTSTRSRVAISSCVTNINLACSQPFYCANRR